MPSNHLILCHPLLLPPSVFPSIRRLTFPTSQFFASRGQRIGVSASASVLPMNIQDWFPLGWTGWIPLQFKALSRVFSNNHSSKASILRRPAFFMVQLSHPYMTTGKNVALARWTFVGKGMSLLFLLFNVLSRLVIAFLPRSAKFQGGRTRPLPWHTLRLWSVLLCVYLNKSTSYPSLCLSLNCFCDETSRTWASLGPETKMPWFWLGLSPKQGFGSVQVPTYGSSPSLW